jgi:hypothetical protein
MSTKVSKAIVERYRCPEEFARFKIERANDPSRGFFKFGEDVVCYGQSFYSTPSSHLNGNLNGNLHDVRNVIQTNGGAAELPFDPDEVVNNLRYERYETGAARDSLKSSVVRVGRPVYYLLRPLMPSFLRVYAKKTYVAGWEKIPFPSWPVDTTVDLLLERLLELSLMEGKTTDIPFIWFWPDGFESCSVMTHDVETNVGIDFIPALMDLDQSAGIKASFQIVPEERYEVEESLLIEIRSRNFEVNVHDLNHDGHLFDDHREFLARVRKINDYARRYRATGYRSGVMYRNQDWYDAFEFEYDMSVPNVAHLDPQHGGCCTVMPYFIGNILELPLTTVQDYSLFYILKDYSIDLWKRQMEMIRRQHGIMSFIVHPDYVIPKRNRATFETLLDYFAQLREGGTVWFALPGEVNRWWRERIEMRLVRSGSGWKIEGSGSERAQLAFAYLRDGKLAYRIGERRLDPCGEIPKANWQRDCSAVESQRT